MDLRMESVILKKTVGLVSLGCPKNLVDSEIMLGLLSADEYEITGDRDNADILIVNTCGFIDSAKQESIETILELARCKQERCKLLIVTGCLAERYRDEIMKEIPEVDAVVGTGDYGSIVEIVKRAEQGEKPVCCGISDRLDYLENERLVSTGKAYAYVKIAEGCSNHCTYCIIPALRGEYRSRKMEDIVKETRALVSQGTKELILIAQDTTRYGKDLYGKPALVPLLRELSAIEGVHWIRLLYCYPEEIDRELIDEIKSNNKICKYLDIPIQHISAKILKLMGRRGTPEFIRNLLDTLRREIPGIILRTSLITGFPGESEEDFNELYEFVKETKFDRLGVFVYSREEGTAAARMKNQVPRRTARQRQRKIMELQREISAEKNRSFLGQMLDVLIEGVSDDGIFYLGRSYAHAPDIDGLIHVLSPEPLENGQIVRVKILNADNYDLIGEVQDESAQ